MCAFQACSNQPLLAFGLGRRFEISQQRFAAEGNCLSHSCNNRGENNHFGFDRPERVNEYGWLRPGMSLASRTA
jgi:hypothetical protein